MSLYLMCMILSEKLILGLEQVLAEALVAGQAVIMVMKFKVEMMDNLD